MKSSLVRHLRFHNSDIKCSYCHVYFSEESQLEEHRKRVHSEKHLCPLCGKNFNLRRALESHLITFHRENTDRGFICPFENCDKVFDKPQAYEFHMNLHLGAKPFTCESCGRSFSNVYKKNNHFKICTGKVTIQCEICGKIFTDKASLVRHDLSVHQLKSFPCVCGATFRYHSSLQRHKQSKNHWLDSMCIVRNIM